MMAEYENASDRTYYKEGKTNVKFGKRVFGGADWSGLESCGEERMGLTVGEEHQRQVLQAGDKDTNVRFLGTDVGSPFYLVMFWIFSCGISSDVYVRLDGSNNPENDCR